MALLAAGHTLPHCSALPMPARGSCCCQPALLCMAFPRGPVGGQGGCCWHRSAPSAIAAHRGSFLPGTAARPAWLCGGWRGRGHALGSGPHTWAFPLLSLQLRRELLPAKLSAWMERPPATACPRGCCAPGEPSGGEDTNLVSLPSPPLTCLWDPDTPCCPSPLQEPHRPPACPSLSHHPCHRTARRLGSVMGKGPFSVVSSPPPSQGALGCWPHYSVPGSRGVRPSSGWRRAARAPRCLGKSRLRGAWEGPAPPNPLCLVLLWIWARRVGEGAEPEGSGPGSGRVDRCGHSPRCSARCAHTGCQHWLSFRVAWWWERPTPFRRLETHVSVPQG